MAARHFNITLAAGAKRLSDVFGGPVGAQPDAALDLPYRQILLTAAVDAFIGDDSAVNTSTDYGIKVASASTFPVSIGPFETGPVKLSQLWGAGGGVLHILAIPF